MPGTRKQEMVAAHSVVMVYLQCSQDPGTEGEVGSSNSRIATNLL